MRNQETVKPYLRFVANILAPLYLFIIFGVTSSVFGCGLVAMTTRYWFFAPICFSLVPLSLVIIAGLLSLAHQKHVVEGRMIVDTAIPSYFHRRLYGLCWTSVYYSGPIYFILLSVPVLKTLTFRIFGYRGSMNFTFYPDTWIRDLPLLDFGEGSYLSNKATIGSNIITIRNQKKVIEVGRIKVGEHGLVGHLSAIAPGVEMGKESSIGICSGVGLKVVLSEKSVVGDYAVVDHGVAIESGASIGSASYVGRRAVVCADDPVASGTTRNRKVRQSEIAENLLNPIGKS